MCLHSASQASSSVVKTLKLLASTFLIAAETYQRGAGAVVLLVRQSGNAGTLVVVQARVSPSTFTLREALIQQQQEQQAAVASLAVLPGCNRTADMHYEFVVGLPQTPWQACPQAVSHALHNMSAGIGADCFHAHCIHACPWTPLTAAASRTTLWLLMLEGPQVRTPKQCCC
jgi:hypothetical protein